MADSVLYYSFLLLLFFFLLILFGNIENDVIRCHTMSSSTGSLLRHIHNKNSLDSEKRTNVSCLWCSFFLQYSTVPSASSTSYFTEKRVMWIKSIRSPIDWCVYCTQVFKLPTSHQYFCTSIHPSPLVSFSKHTYTIHIQIR